MGGRIGGFLLYAAVFILFVVVDHFVRVVGLLYLQNIWPPPYQLTGQVPGPAFFIYHSVFAIVSAGISLLVAFVALSHCSLCRVVTL